MIPLRHNSASFITLAIACFILISCGARKKDYKSPPGYDLNHPLVYKMPQTLNEISGVVFYPKDSGIFSINDEQGWLYKVFLQKTPLQVERWKFANAGDYEDLALVDSTVFVLKSKGKLEKFNFAAGEVVNLQSFPIPFEEEKKEFETLFYDPNKKQLVVICKDCKGDGGLAFGWTFNPVTDSFTSNFSLNTQDAFNQLKKTDEKNFKASAAAVNPLTGELFIISSVQKILAIYDKDYKFKSAYAIDPSIYKQPEGLCFTPKGDLIISNEAASSGVANILVFKLHSSNTNQ